MWVEHPDICYLEFHCGLLFHFDPFWLTDCSSNLAGNILTLRKRGFFGWNFLGVRKGGISAGIFLTLRKRGFLTEFFDPPQERVFVDHVVCVGNCVVCVLSVFVVGGWGWVGCVGWCF